MNTGLAYESLPPPNIHNLTFHLTTWREHYFLQWHWTSSWGAEKSNMDLIPRGTARHAMYNRLCIYNALINLQQYVRATLCPTCPRKWSYMALHVIVIFLGMSYSQRETFLGPLHQTWKHYYVDCSLAIKHIFHNGLSCQYPQTKRHPARNTLTYSPQSWSFNNIITKTHFLSCNIKDEVIARPH